MTAAEQRVLAMAHDWWIARRPLTFTLRKHIENPAINCATETDKNLAKAVADMLQERRAE